MCLFDQQSLEILEVNQAACALYGYPCEELLGKKVSDIYPEEEIRRLLQSVENHEAPSEPAGVWEHVRKDNSTIYVQVSASASTYLGRKAALAVIHDVTALKQLEGALHASQKQLETRVRQRTTELEKANAELRRVLLNKQRLERKILEVSESEQRKLGEDLHDDLGQQLTGMSLLASVLATDLRKQANPLAEEAQSLVNYLGEASLCARNLAKGLYPIALDRGGFRLALDQLASRISRISNVLCELKYDDSFKLTDNDAIQLYRIVQEAVNNAIKHGQARRIQIECKAEKKNFLACVINDGLPFREPQQIAKGMGLSLMRHRARMIGARLAIRRGPEGGCETICTIPKVRPGLGPKR
jgi:PAS domain S-box-containing protein